MTTAEAQLYRVGLTGSIAMGKSTTASMFRDLGVPVHDADAAVARLYAPGGAAATAIAQLGPNLVQQNGEVDRAALKAAIAADPEFLPRLEAVVHPLVTADRAGFDVRAAAAGASYVLHDVPLLFETDMAAEMDAIIVVSAAPEVQRARAMARPGMTAAHLDTILARQIPDAEKRRRADIIIMTDDGFDAARQAVEAAHATLLRWASVGRSRSGDQSDA